ncbi:MAG TPA: hypothetical protein VLH86_03950 [Patescibacteria group bacterium]|nr:hypothetical protein [Patescibacteria group bacterium]
MNPNNEQGYQSNDPLLSEDDRPAGGNQTKGSSYTVNPNGAKKSIQPIDEAAVRQVLADSTPTKPAIDVSKVYQTLPAQPATAPSIAPLPPTATSTAAAPQPPPAAAPTAAQPTPPPAAADQTAREPISVAQLVPDLQLYATVMLILSVLGTIARLNLLRLEFNSYHALVRIHDANPAYAAPQNPLDLSMLIGLATASLPLLAAIYLLVGKKIVLVKAVLILLCIDYAVGVASIIMVLIKVQSGTLIVSGMLAAGLLAWTYFVAKSVFLADEPA